MTTLLTIGTYDCPHAGHAAFLRTCERYADGLIVAIRSDTMVRRLRGYDPVFTYDERAAIISRLGYQVVESNEPGRQLIFETAPDVLAIGTDWMYKDLLGRYGITGVLLEQLNTTLAYIPYTQGISTSDLKVRLALPADCEEDCCQP